MFVPVVFLIVFSSFTSFSFADDIRLKQKISPNAYEIRLYPDLQNGNFSGQVTIQIDVEDYVSTIELHGQELVVAEGHTKLSKIDSTPEDITVRSVNTTGGLIRVNLQSDISFGKYALRIDFRGKIRDDMTGFYRSYYEYQGKKRWLGATQFEPYYARRAFPCFDEPRFRASFTLEIVVPANHDVISNVKASNGVSNSLTFHFENYPKMPTYLLAWVIFERYTFVSTEPYKINGTEYRLWTQADYINQSDHANMVASRLLTALSSYLQIPYTLEKMDQVAIPDFSAGAMENWGIVTYRESGLLYQDKISTSDDFRMITMVIAHEFTHQWFGNLVTPQWWSYTWLNEAFARYFQYFITLEVYTDWRLDEQFVLMALQPSLEYDSSPQQAMTSEINSLSDINGKFDLVTYSKGASIVRMMEHILTKEIFRAGLSRYIKDVSYRGVAEPNDLFKILSGQAKDLPYNFETIMRTWTDQAGYPVLFVRRQENNTILISQKRGLYDQDSKDNTIWYIPLTYTTKSEANFSNTAIRDWLITEQKTIRIPGDTNDWVIFNIQQKGFYRVSYDDQIWNAIINQLRSDHSQIGTLNRAQLIDDAFFFVKAGLLDINTALNVTAYLAKDIDYAPWYAAINGLSDLMDQFYAETEVYTALEDYARKLLASVAHNVGFIVYNGDKMAQKLKRMKVLNFAAKLSHQSALSVADQIVKDLATNSTTSYSPDLQQALLCTGLKNSNDSEAWKSIYTLYQKSLYPTQQTRLLFSLACTKNADLLSQLVKDTISGEPKVRRQNVDRLFKEMGNTPHGAKFLLAYVTTGTNYEDLIRFNFDKPKIIGDIINGISGKIYTTEDIETIKTFNTHANLTEAIHKKISSAVTKINKRLERTGATKESVQKWLKEVDIPTTTVSPLQTTGTGQVETSTATVPGTTPKSSGVRNTFNTISIILILFYNLL